MHYIKSGVLQSFRVKVFSVKVVDNLERLQIMLCLTQHQKQPQKCILGYIDKHQQTDIHRLVSASDFPRSGNGGGGHSREKKEISTTKC